MSYTDFDVDGIDVSRVASDWHSGQWSALYSFASTGTIRSDLSIEVERCLRDLKAGDDTETLREELQALLSYVTQPILSVWSSYGHTFMDSDGSYASCLTCGAEFELVRDEGADPSHGAYQASNGDEPTYCQGTGAEHGEDRSEDDAGNCNCVLCA